MADLTLPDSPEAPDVAADGVWLRCIECGDEHPPFEDIVYTCESCGGLLEVRYDRYPTFDEFDGTGVWRYGAALPFENGVTLPEGNTPLHRMPRLESELDVRNLRIKHEGMNPTGSFKDRGMTVGVRVAEELGVDRLACASTGNTSAALAAYGARAGLETLVLLPAGKVAAGKIAQASLHDARILEVDGNFDACLDIVQELADRGEAYLLNSLNPFRLEGQKTIGLEILEEFRDDHGRFPDRIVLPVGNAGNTAALYKCFREMVASGDLAPGDVPKLTGVQAAGAAPMVEAIEEGLEDTRRWEDVETIATAIRIGNPARWQEASAALDESDGQIHAVTDDEILEAYRELSGEEGIFCEPASAASWAGLKKLSAEGFFDGKKCTIAATLTGHGLKDPDMAVEMAEEPEKAPNELEAVVEMLGLA